MFSSPPWGTGERFGGKEKEHGVTTVAPSGRGGVPGGAAAALGVFSGVFLGVFPRGVMALDDLPPIGDVARLAIFIWGVGDVKGVDLLERGDF